MTLDGLLTKMWKDYVAINPLAQKVYDLFVQHGESVVNDHIALRTFSHPRINVDVIAKPFLDMGYKFVSDYEFPEKKLYAKHYQHSDEKMPKIFISQLKLELFPTDLKQMINSLIDQIPQGKENTIDFSCSGRPWEIDTATYFAIQKHSDYAAWVAALGYRPNHFTVFMNELKKFASIQELNEFLKKNGFKLNSSGGEVKGSPELLLEQSSTLANNIEVKFSDKKLTIPGCYYEFAKRYPNAEGQLYQGFVAKSADKIFESTFEGQ